MSGLLAGVGLALLVVAWILHPLVTGRSAPMHRDDDELTDVQHRKRIALLALRDVEYDHHAGKLDEADYLAMKRKISAEALSALDEEERALSPGSPESLDVEAEIRALRATLREGAVCQECGNPNAAGSRFCGACGAALARARASG